MGQFSRQRHPWIMQAVGGLIALIVFAPFAVIVWVNLIANAKPQQATVTYAPARHGGGRESPGCSNGAAECDGWELAERR